jgi:hypothetical protein
MVFHATVDALAAGHGNRLLWQDYALRQDGNSPTAKQAFEDATPLEMRHSQYSAKLKA